MGVSAERTRTDASSGAGTTSSESETLELHVCVSCRQAGAPRGPLAERSGYQFYKQVRDALEGSPLQARVELRPAECLSVCPRPCGIALSRAGAWTYLFGDQSPGETVNDLLTCLERYLESPDGFLTRNERPTSFRRSILGRVPPLREGTPCT